jgi:hypothetical protein
MAVGDFCNMQFFIEGGISTTNADCAMARLDARATTRRSKKE